MLKLCGRARLARAPCREISNETSQRVTISAHRGVAAAAFRSSPRKPPQLRCVESAIPARSAPDAATSRERTARIARQVRTAPQKEMTPGSVRSRAGSLSQMNADSISAPARKKRSTPCCRAWRESDPFCCSARGGENSRQARTPTRISISATEMPLQIETSRPAASASPIQHRRATNQMFLKHHPLLLFPLPRHRKDASETCRGREITGIQIRHRAKPFVLFRKSGRWQAEQNRESGASSADADE